MPMREERSDGKDGQAGMNGCNALDLHALMLLLRFHAHIKVFMIVFTKVPLYCTIQKCSHSINNCLFDIFIHSFFLQKIKDFLYSQFYMMKEQNESYCE